MVENRQKKLMLLGGGRYLLPAIEAAHKLGAYVITADYLPDNYAHKFSDEYVNVSIIDQEAVLRVAREKKIDGIMSFACDPGVVPAAYVAEKMGLPAPCSYKSAMIMQNKCSFRSFLRDNNFNVPWFKAYINKEVALKEESNFEYPLVVKPVDASGSRGVSLVRREIDLSQSIDNAIENSLSGAFIIEKYIQMVGSQSGSDSFVKNGKLVLASFDRQFYDNNSPNPFTPTAMCYPSNMPIKIQNQLRDDIQRAISLLGIKTSIINIECRLGIDGKAYIMEITPRAGGNRVPEIISMASKCDLIGNAVKGALDMEIDDMDDPQYDGSYARVVLHTNKSGIFQRVTIDGNFEKEYVIEKDLFVKEGEHVTSFSGANKSIGLLLAYFPDIDTAEKYLTNITNWVKVEILK